MVNTLALLVKRPTIDFGDTMRNAANLRQAGANLERTQIGNVEARSKLSDYLDQSSALRGYRGALEAGDPHAADRLRGYPEMQAQFHKAFQSMKPDEQSRVAKRIEAVGELAREIATLPDGSPQRQSAWERGINELHGEGFLTDEQASAALEQGPSANDMLLQEATTLKDWVNTARGGTSGDFDYKVVEGRLAKIPKHGGGGVEFLEPPGTDQETYDRLSTADKLKIDRVIMEEAKAGLPSYGVSEDEMRNRIGRARQDVMQRFFPDSAPGGGAGGGDETIPDAAVEYLREHPDLAPQFDQKYGAGAADRALNR